MALLTVQSEMPKAFLMLFQEAIHGLQELIRIMVSQPIGEILENISVVQPSGSATGVPVPGLGVTDTYVKTQAASARATGPHNASVENRPKHKKKPPPRKPFELISR